MAYYQTIEGYVVRRTTEKAVGLVKEGALPSAEITWVPKACCRDGDALETGDTDLMVTETMCDEKGLDY